MTVLRYLTIPDDTALLAAIGRVAVAHAQLDYVLRLTIKVMEDRSHDDVMNDAKLRGSKALRKRIGKQADKRISDVGALKKLKTLLEKAKGAADRRNEYLHNVFGSDDRAKYWTHTEYGKSYDLPSVAQLNDLTEKLQLIMKELNTARRKGWLVQALDKKKTKKKEKKVKGRKTKGNPSGDHATSEQTLSKEARSQEGKTVEPTKSGRKGNIALVTADVAEPLPPTEVKMEPIELTTGDGTTSVAIGSGSIVE